MLYFSTGEVSKKLNVSVRTLRYYDQINLLNPSYREDSGKRYYSEEDMLLIEKIKLLKSLSVPLDNIKKILEEASIGKILDVHKNMLESQLHGLEESLKHTTTLIHILKLEGELNWEQLLPLVKVSEDNKKAEEIQRAWNSFFTEEEQVALSASLPKLEAENSGAAKWINIIKRIELCLNDKKEPGSPDGQLIAEDILLLSREAFNNDPELAEKFWEIRKSETLSDSLNLYPVKKEVIEFVEEAVAVLENGGHSLASESGE